MEDSIKERAEKIGYVLQNPNQMISLEIFIRFGYYGQSVAFFKRKSGFRVSFADERNFYAASGAVFILARNERQRAAYRAKNEQRHT